MHVLVHRANTGTRTNTGTSTTTGTRTKTIPIRLSVGLPTSLSSLRPITSLPLLPLSSSVFCIETCNLLRRIRRLLSGSPRRPGLVLWARKVSAALHPPPTHPIPPHWLPLFRQGLFYCRGTAAAIFRSIRFGNSRKSERATTPWKSTGKGGWVGERVGCGVCERERESGARDGGAGGVIGLFLVEREKVNEYGWNVCRRVELLE